MGELAGLVGCGALWHAGQIKILDGFLWDRRAANESRQLYEHHWQAKGGEGGMS